MAPPTQAVTRQTNVQRVKNQLIPDEGPRCVPFFFDWSTSAQYECNLVNFMNQGNISIIQGAWVDNSGNANALTIQSTGTGQIVQVPPYTQGYFPLFALNPCDFIITSTSGAYNSKVTFYNVPIAPGSWMATAFATFAGTLTVTDPTLDGTVSGNKVQIADKSVYTPLGYQQITSLSAASGLTVPQGATFAWIIAEAQAVRWRDDGTNPTASVGIPLAVSTGFWYNGSLSAIKFIEQTASAKLNISYYS